MTRPEQQVLQYIQIDHKNKIEELSAESQITESMNLLNSLTLAEENIIGGEINKFFYTILPENKEGETLKVLTSIANRAKINKDQYESSLSKIMNKKESNKVILSKELSEDLSIILKGIFKKIKKKSKFKNFEDLIEKTKNFLPNNSQDDILKKYKINKNPKKISACMTFNEEAGKDYQNILSINNFDSTKSSDALRLKQQNSAGETNQLLYKYREFKEDKNLPIPVEMIILMRKFNMVKKLKLTINKDYNPNNDEEIENSEEIFMDQDDIQNNIIILLNLPWLFQSLVDLEVDLSNDNLIDSEINVYRYSLECFAKLIHKDIKITTYQNKQLNKRNYDFAQKSIFSQYFLDEEEDILADKNSVSMMMNNTLNYSVYPNLNKTFAVNTNISNSSNSDVMHNNLKEFIKKYLYLLEMIIIYGYFIRNMSTIIKTKFIMPLNLGDEIYSMLKRQKIFINDFHFLSFLTNTNIIYITIDFNSLDNQTFEKLLSFLNQNQNISVCNISFFPSEEYFKTELLYKILQNCDENFKLKKNKKNKLSFNPNIVLDLKGNEDIDNYILRKLFEYFEKNLKKFFYFLTIKTCITELSLIFDIPTILNKNGYYNNILMKFFLDLFILIDSSLSNIKTLSLNSENFIFDSRKYPILNDFCDKLSSYLKKDHKLTNLTFQVKFYNIRKIYRFIPYNLTNLSIGSLDYETFICLVDYLTSSDYSLRTKLNKLKINLNNSVIDINKDKIYETIIRLFVEFPKDLSEISLYSYLIISYEQLYNLLIKTNYSTLMNIFVQFSMKSFLKDKELENNLEYDMNQNDKIINIKTENFIDLYAINRKKAITSNLINLMMHLGEKNKDFMQYNIYTNIEKFLCDKEKKKVIIQFK